MCFKQVRAAAALIDLKCDCLFYLLDVCVTDITSPLCCDVIPSLSLPDVFSPSHSIWLSSFFFSCLTSASPRSASLSFCRLSVWLSLSLSLYPQMASVLLQNTHTHFKIHPCKPARSIITQKQYAHTFKFTLMWTSAHRTVCSCAEWTWREDERWGNRFHFNTTLAACKLFVTSRVTLSCTGRVEKPARYSSADSDGRTSGVRALTHTRMLLIFIGVNWRSEDEEQVFVVAGGFAASLLVSELHQLSHDE